MISWCRKRKSETFLCVSVSLGLWWSTEDQSFRVAVGSIVWFVCQVELH